MTSELNHILMAACLLIVAGFASFPYRLSYGNTAWLPRKMRPDRAYLERPYEYDYPAHNINLLFSVSVILIGTLALIFILAPDLPEDVPAERWFSALAVLYPAYASCQVLFWRKDYGDGFCYADRLTAFNHGKTDTILLIAAALDLENCKKLVSRAIDLNLEVLLEIHEEKELDYISPDISMIGINNRNLGSFQTCVDHSFRLGERLPKEAIKISESGISSPQTVYELRRAGFQGFLIGETFMRTEYPEQTLRHFLSELTLLQKNKRV